eukprot:387554-Prymnesium_polylepis.1
MPYPSTPGLFPNRPPEPPGWLLQQFVSFDVNISGVTRRRNLQQSARSLGSSVNVSQHQQQSGTNQSSPPICRYAPPVCGLETSILRSHVISILGEYFDWITKRIVVVQLRPPIINIQIEGACVELAASLTPIVAILIGRLSQVLGLLLSLIDPRNPLGCVANLQARPFLPPFLPVAQQSDPTPSPSPLPPPPRAQWPMTSPTAPSLLPSLPHSPRALIPSSLSSLPATSPADTLPPLSQQPDHDPPQSIDQPRHSPGVVGDTPPPALPAPDDHPPPTPPAVVEPPPPWTSPETRFSPAPGVMTPNASEIVVALKEFNHDEALPTEVLSAGAAAMITVVILLWTCLNRRRRRQRNIERMRSSQSPGVKTLTFTACMQAQNTPPVSPRARAASGSAPSSPRLQCVSGDIVGSSMGCITTASCSSSDSRAADHSTYAPEDPVRCVTEKQRPDIPHLKMQSSRLKEIHQITAPSRAARIGAARILNAQGSCYPSSTSCQLQRASGQYLQPSPLCAVKPSSPKAQRVYLKAKLSPFLFRGSSNGLSYRFKRSSSSARNTADFNSESRRSNSLVSTFI